MAEPYDVHMASGDIVPRQIAANAAGAQCFIDQHLNAAADPSVNYAFVILAAGASTRTEDWARRYLELVGSELGQRVVGVRRGIRGAGNVRHCRCPAMLVEPGMISHVPFAAMVRTGEGIDALAYCLAASIYEFFPSPDAGPIALSAGHAGRSRPDPGAPFHDKGDEHVDPAFDDEAELNVEICRSAGEMLTAGYERGLGP